MTLKFGLISLKVTKRPTKCHHTLIQMLLNPDWCTEVRDLFSYWAPPILKPARRAQRKNQKSFMWNNQNCFKLCQNFSKRAARSSSSINVTWSLYSFLFFFFNVLCIMYVNVTFILYLVMTCCISRVRVGSALWCWPEKGRNMPSTFFFFFLASFQFGLLWRGGSCVSLYVSIQVRKFRNILSFSFFFTNEIFVFSILICVLNIGWLDLLHEAAASLLRNGQLFFFFA